MCNGGRLLSVSNILVCLPLRELLTDIRRISSRRQSTKLFICWCCCFRLSICKQFELRFEEASHSIQHSK